MDHHPNFNKLFDLWLKDVFAGDYPTLGQFVVTPVYGQNAETLLQIDVHAHASGKETQGLRLVIPRELLFK